MNAQQLHHRSVPHEFLYSVDTDDFAALHMSEQIMNEDSYWDEDESEYADASFPSHVLSFINDVEFE